MKTRTVLSYSLFLASALCLVAAAQSNQSTPPGKQWPIPGQSADERKLAASDAVGSLTATLTRAGYDKTFRQGLSQSCESAKQNVSREGNIEIPNDVVTMFYEPDAYKDHFGFILPPFNPDAHPDYKYADPKYYQCCFPIVKKFEVATIDKPLADALDAAMTRAGYDSAFRERLSVNCESAKKAVAEVGKDGPIQIGDNIQMIFKDKDKGDDRYHIFVLPPFDANSRCPRAYGEYFVGMYPLWPQKVICVTPTTHKQRPKAKKSTPPEE